MASGAPSRTNIELPVAHDILDIKYSNEDLEQIKEAKGIFSFCVYTGNGVFDKNITNFGELIMIGDKPPILYYIGLISYLQMIINDPSKWNGWKVIIHTDEATIDGNPKAFNKLKEKGAIIGLTTLKGKYEDISKFRGIFRNNRYYPLFIQGINIPIFIRDADTIFEHYISDKLFETFDKKSVINITKNEDIILDDFITKLSNWEYMFFTKANKLNNKVIFSYDNNYSLKLTNENKINDLIWSGSPSNKPTNKTNFFTKKVRFLAGNVSKIGEALPIELWTAGFSEFINKYITNNNISGNIKKLEIKTGISDEVFLTEVIYKWCKTNNKAEFFMMNYVLSSRLYTLFNKYIKGKYGDKGNINSLADTFNKTNKEFYNKMNPKKLTAHQMALGKQPINEITTRLLANTISLNHPEIPLNNEYFYNPLHPISNKPKSMPSYFFGGKPKKTIKHRKLKNKKTRKHRK